MLATHAREDDEADGCDEPRSERQDALSVFLLRFVISVLRSGTSREGAEDGEHLEPHEPEDAIPDVAAYERSSERSTCGEVTSEVPDDDHAEEREHRPV